MVCSTFSCCANLLQIWILLQVGMVENFNGRLDICLALHACGNATDYALIKAVENQAAYIISPCCVGECHETSTLPIRYITQLEQQCY